MISRRILITRIQSPLYIINSTVHGYSIEMKHWLEFWSLELLLLLVLANRVNSVANRCHTKSFFTIALVASRLMLSPIVCMEGSNLSANMLTNWKKYDTNWKQRQFTFKVSGALPTRNQHISVYFMSSQLVAITRQFVCNLFAISYCKQLFPGNRWLQGVADRSQDMYDWSLATDFTV